MGQDLELPTQIKETIKIYAYFFLSVPLHKCCSSVWGRLSHFLLRSVAAKSETEECWFKGRSVRVIQWRSWFSFWMWPCSHYVQLRFFVQFIAGVLLVLGSCLQGTRSELLLADYELAAKWEWEDTDGSVRLLPFVFSLEHYFSPSLLRFFFFNFELIFPAASSEMSRA